MNVTTIISWQEQQQQSSYDSLQIQNENTEYEQQSTVKKEKTI